MVNPCAAGPQVPLEQASGGSCSGRSLAVVAHSQWSSTLGLFGVLFQTRERKKNVKNIFAMKNVLRNENACIFVVKHAF